nr:uncharacterized protein LOC127331005 [Lolium perenne]
MTVRRQAGVTDGDLAIQTPASASLTSEAPDQGPRATVIPEVGSSASEALGEVSGGSSERPIGRRFWALQSDEEDDGGSGDEEVEFASSVRGGDRLASFFCRTPTPSRDADLAEGLTWKKSEAAAPVIRRRTAEVVMSGDGGRGGFNPGRGGFNPGRGGYGGGRGNFGGRGDFGGGRGDFGGGRGDFAGGRGEYGYGGGRGDYGKQRGGYGAGRGGYGGNRAEYAPRGRFGHAGRGNTGYGGGRGHQGNGFGGFGANRQFVQGESSG